MFKRKEKNLTEVRVKIKIPLDSTEVSANAPCSAELATSACEPNAASSATSSLVDASDSLSSIQSVTVPSCHAPSNLDSRLRSSFSKALGRCFDGKQVFNTILLTLTTIAVAMLAFLNMGTITEYSFYGLGVLFSILLVGALLSSIKFNAKARNSQSYQLPPVLHRSLRPVFITICTLLIAAGSVQGLAAMRCGYLEARRILLHQTDKPEDMAAKKKEFDELSFLFGFFHSPWLSDSLLQCEYRSCHYKEALILADKVLASEPGDDYAVAIKAGSLEFLGEQDRWRALVPRLQAIDSKPQNYAGINLASELGRLACISADSNRMEQALVYINAKLRLEPEDANSYSVRAKIYKKLGLVRESEADLARAKQLEEHK